ncbi:MAG: GatB/YqeY domain-containing protein [Pseudomonadota bacterium]
MREQITSAMKQAMKDKDAARLSVLRLINAAIKDRDIALRTEEGSEGASDSEILQLLGKLIKQREESATSFEEAGRLDSAERERAEILTIREFLPTPLTAEEADAAVNEIVAEIGANSIKDMGKVMGALKERYAGRMDFGKVGPKVKDALTSG